MSLSSTSATQNYDGNGATTAFSTVFPFLANSDLVVKTTVVATGVTTTKTITTDYTVTGAATGAAGTVTMLSAPATGTRLTIKRAVPLTQLVDYVRSDPFPADTHEAALDKLTMLVQQLQAQVNRCIQFPDTETTSADGTLGLAAARASKVIAFDSTGNAIAMQAFGQWKGNWATATAYIYGDIIKDAASTNNLYICATAHTSGTFATDLAASKWTLLVDVSSVTTSTAAAAASATAAASSASSASTSATNASTSATNASTSATNAATSATNAASSATSAASSATSASSSATSASSSATSAASSATAAAASATTAANTAEGLRGFATTALSSSNVNLTANTDYLNQEFTGTLGAAISIAALTSGSPLAGQAFYCYFVNVAITLANTITFKSGSTTLLTITDTGTLSGCYKFVYNGSAWNIYCLQHSVQ